MQFKWNGSDKTLAVLFVAGIVLTFSQILLGTQVREAIDTIAAGFEFTNRDQWISNIGIEFLIHRSYSLIILALHVYLVYYLIKNITDRTGRFYTLSKVSGALMAYFAIPAILQPVHLLVALIIIGLQYYLLLQTRSYSRHNLSKVSNI